MSYQYGVADAAASFAASTSWGSLALGAERKRDLTIDQSIALLKTGYVDGKNVACNRRD